MIAWKRAFGIAREKGGGVAIEFAIISSVLILGGIGALEFGRALYARSEMSYAADLAEREILMDPDISEEAIRNTIHSAFDGDAELLTIELGEETVDGVQYRTVAVSYPFSLLVPYFSTKQIGLSVDRRTPVS